MASISKERKRLSTFEDAHEKWLHILNRAQDMVKEDMAIQKECKAGKPLKDRALAPEILGRFYASYCNLINQLYDAYLNSVHLQRSPYILNLVNLFVKRMYELRKELVNLIVTEYIYVDAGLVNAKLTPFDIQIVVPYHFPLECRSETTEQALQKMWAAAIRKKRLKKIKPPKPETSTEFRRRKIQDQDAPSHSRKQDDQLEEEEEYESTPESSVQIIDEGAVQPVIIQRMERYRQWYMEDFRQKCNIRRTYFAVKVFDPPIELKTRAALLIQRVYREVMKIKRERLLNEKRDVLLGMLPEHKYGKLSFTEENNKVYEKRRTARIKIKESYLKELESENTKLLLCKWDGQVDDITDQIREWFKEWYYGYGFFPQYPYEVEGGTIIVINGQYPTIEEQVEEDIKEAERRKAPPVDKKEERAIKKAEAKKKAEDERRQKKKEALALFKAKCNPEDDPGYTPETSAANKEIVEALTDYRAKWSLYDDFSKSSGGSAIYGYMKTLLNEDLLCKMHKDCRTYVDQLMRLELKLLITAHKQLYKSIGKEFPKTKPRPKRKAPPVPKPFNLTPEIKSKIEPLFDMDLITKPTTKLSDVYGDVNFGNYEYTVLDPNAKFLPPSYGDVKDRLMLSCVLGSGIQPGATRRKAVMLLGPPRNGKSFLVDAVAGELNAVKIDISPEVFSAVAQSPTKLLPAVFVAARAFQPAVIFLKDIERVYSKKVPPQDEYLKAPEIASVLPKLVKEILERDNIIFLATCSYPLVAKAKLMASIFQEIIVVPSPDYGSITKFFYDNLQKEVSVPSNFPYSPLGQVLRGYSFGIIIEAYHTVMCPARIASMNIKPLTPSEFLEAAMNIGEPLAPEELAEYEQFYLNNSSIKNQRLEFEEINKTREDYYKKMTKKAKNSEGGSK